MIVGHMMCKDRLRELGLFCLKKLKQGGYFIRFFNYLAVESKENRAFGRNHRDGARGNRHRLKPKEIPFRDAECFYFFSYHEYSQVLEKGIQ